jgi:predicted lipid-binding transport protein (Tim44 family)
MPLSEHEQRILAEIERRLLEEDPKFAHQVGSSFRAHLGRRLKLAVAGFILGLLVVISSTFFENVAIGVAGFVIMLTCVFLFVRTMRRRATVERPVSGPAPAGGTGTAAPAPRRQGGPKGGIDAWWGRMTDRWRSRWEERGGQGPP